MNQPSHLIRVFCVAGNNYMASDEKKDVSEMGNSREEAAVNLIRRHTDKYDIRFVDLSHCNLSTQSSPHGKADIVIFGDKRRGVPCFRATVRSGKGRVEAFAPDVFTAAFNLICYNHPIFNIDFDLTEASREIQLPDNPDEEPEIVIERRADC